MKHILASLAVLTLAACGNSGTDSAPNNDNKSSKVTFIEMIIQLHKKT